jgi:tape measure domain-containing protein
MADTIIARLRLEGQRQFSRDAQQASKDVKGIGDAADQTAVQGEEMSKKGGTWGPRIKSAAKTAAVGLAAAGTAATVMGLKYNAGMEQATVSFKGLLGSQDEAEKMMGRLQKFAAETPFEQAQLVSAAQRWVGVGNSAKSVIPSMRSVGDAVAAVGGAPEDVMGVVTALTQMQNKGKASAEELQQIAERNIPAFKILQKELGLTGAQLTDKMQKGALGADKAVAAILTGMEKRYKGSMSAQSKTFTGMLSTIKDNLNMILGTAVQPLFKWLQAKVFPWLIKITNQLVKAGKQGGLKAMIETLTGAAGKGADLAAVLKTTADFLGTMRKNVRGFDWATFFGTLSSVAQPFAAVLFTIVGLFNKLMGLPGAPQAVGGLLALTAAGMLANKMMGGLLSTFGTLAIESVRMTTTMAQLVTQVLAYRTARMLQTGADTAAAGATEAQAIAMTQQNATQQMGLIGTIRYTAATIASKIATLASSAATKAWAAAQWLLNIAMRANPIMLVVTGIMLLVAGLILAYKKSETFRTIVDAAFRWVKRAAMDAFNWVKKNWPLLLGIIAGPIGLAVGMVIKHWDRIKEGAKSVYNSVKSWFGKIKTFISGIFHAGDFVAGLGRGLADWLNANTPFGDRVEFKVLGKSVGFTIPALAEGGTIMRGGTALVGERGPELVSLPQAAVVQPLAQGGGAFTIEVPVFLDRRQIALAVGQYSTDQAARKGRAV